jgi:hypothetical protein
MAQTHSAIAPNYQTTPTNTDLFVHQQLLLDEQGFVLESTDTIFKADRHRPASEWSLFFASLHAALSQIPMHTTEILLPRVSSITSHLDGLFDCTFMWVRYCDVDRVLVWNIMNQTPQLAMIQAFQQRYNESCF